jgi:hypothetical protein
LTRAASKAARQRQHAPGEIGANLVLDPINNHDPPVQPARAFQQAGGGEANQQSRIGDDNRVLAARRSC